MSQKLSFNFISNGVTLLVAIKEINGFVYMDVKQDRIPYRIKSIDIKHDLKLQS